VTIKHRNGFQTEKIERSNAGDTEIVFDELGRVKEVKEEVDGIFQAATVTYDDLGRISSALLANGMERQSTYDDLGRLESKKYIKDNIVKYDLTYDYQNGRLKSVVENPGNVELIKFDYDNLGRVSKRTYALGETIETPAETSYDPVHKSRVVQEIFKESVADGGAVLRTIDYTYDDLGRLVEITDNGDMLLKYH